LPPFPVEDATPTPTGQGVPANVLTAIQNRFNNPALSALPPNIDASFVRNPNLYLERDIQALTQKKQSLQNQITATFIISATLDNPPNGGIINMPFLSNNTKVTRFDATLWIESIKQDDGQPFMQLQYSQKVILDFGDIEWPHISVATLIKQ
jgi:hypothetical protein